MFRYYTVGIYLHTPDPCVTFLPHWLTVQCAFIATVPFGDCISFATALFGDMILMSYPHLGTVTAVPHC